MPHGCQREIRQGGEEVEDDGDEEDDDDDDDEKSAPPLWRVRLASRLFFILVTFHVRTEGLRIHTLSRIHTNIACF